MSTTRSLRSDARLPGAVLWGFVLTSTGCVIIGLLGATVGVPANNAFVPLEPPSDMWKLYAVALAWVVWAAMMTYIAIFRARYLHASRISTRGLAWRGSVWLWGAIGAPWIYVWVPWDIGLHGSDPPERMLGSAIPIVLSIAVWWWFGALLCLMAGTVWSTVTYVAHVRSGPRGAAYGQATGPRVDVHSDNRNQGSTVPEDTERAAPHHIPTPGEASVPEIEEDENIPPRPEEEIADEMRAKPDVADHARHPE